MKSILTILSLGALLLLADTADARSRYERGRTLYRRHCSACLSMGWDWTPTREAVQKRLPLRVMAKKWAPSKVCTWLRKRSRKTRGQACYPGRIRARDRLDMLYYLYQRARSAFKRPVKRIRRVAPRYKGKGFRSNLKARRRTAMQREQQRRLLRKMRNRGQRRGGARRGHVVKPKRVIKRVRVKRTKTGERR